MSAATFISINALHNKDGAGELTHLLSILFHYIQLPFSGIRRTLCSATFSLLGKKTQGTLLPVRSTISTARMQQIRKPMDETAVLKLMVIFQLQQGKA